VLDAGMTRKASDRPRRRLPTGVVTFVFTDIERSTDLLRALGPGFTEVLEAHNAIMRRAIDAHGGTEIRTEGDSFFCAFPSASEAVAACLDAQLALRSHPWPLGGEVRARMGVHTGQAELGGDDYVSLAVHQAARVADTAHGGQVVVSPATRGLALDHLPDGAWLEAAGRYRLRDFAEPPVLYVLRHPDLGSDFPALRALPAAAHNVPEPATMFVGRATALRELADLVGTLRLTTVLGAGGVGKTRLATEVVPVVAERFRDGVWMVELARLRRREDVAPEVATIMGVRPEPDRRPVDTVADALAGRHLLLVLDNCEHVVEATAELVERLVARCPEVNVLATSRVPLGLPAEWRYPLAPLQVPGVADLDAASTEAVALFVDRARVVAPGFDLGREEQAVFDICRRLDGLPLAIELAAARAASIPAASIAQRLDRRFSVLKQAHRATLPHHATLRASIEWSYDLLEPEEQMLFRRLGAFTGEFDLEATEAVCGGAPLVPDDVLDLLGVLVDKSLVQRTGDRYIMLETIREFARERLAGTEEADIVAAAHVVYFTHLVETAALEAEGPGQRAAYDRIDADLPNVRAAVQWALERSDPAALRLGAALGQYAFVRNRLTEVAGWCFDATAAVPNAPLALRVRALAQAAFVLVTSGNTKRGHRLATDAVELARGAEDPRLLVETLLMAADLSLEESGPGRARPFSQEALARVGEVGDLRLEGRVVLVAARADAGRESVEATHERLAPALTCFERAGDVRQQARVLLTQAYLSLAAGELEAAAREAARCAELTEELGHSIGAAVARIVTVWVAIERGELDEARRVLGAIVPTARECRYVALLGYCATALAALAARAGADRQAARLAGAIQATEGSLGGEGQIALSDRMRRLATEVTGRLGERAWAAEAESGARAGLDALVAEGA
jgi:predicted ATPase/class 3 adenylate cyclase